jgi:hypothetical protein
MFIGHPTTKEFEAGEVRSQTSQGSHDQNPVFFYQPPAAEIKIWLQKAPIRLRSSTYLSFTTVSPEAIFSLCRNGLFEPGSLTVFSKDPGARWASLSIALRITTLSRDAMNECAHVWIAVALPMLFVGPDIVRVLAGSDKPPLIEKRDFTVDQSFYPFDAIRILDQH